MPLTLIATGFAIECLALVAVWAIVARPPRTDAHATRDRLIAQFRDAGLVPVVSTNGAIPGADIQVVKGEKPGEVVDCWLTARGEQRLASMAHREAII